jgi:alkylation response protein AidB-like acyl-CoA dehydrogenase
MSATSPAAEAYERLRADIRAWGPEIAARAAEIEAGRRIPPDLVEALKSIGAFRLFIPRSGSGLEFDLPRALRVFRALARIDGSVGWTVMIGNAGHLLASLLPRATYDEVYRNGPDLITAGSLVPAGTAEAAPGGFQVTGRWPFASGCLHSGWLLGLCIMTEGGKPVAGPGGAGGPPRIRGFFLPTRDWQIEDTWHAVGLKGSGSHHVALRDGLVPAANFFDFPDGAPCLPGPLYESAHQLLPLLHGAVTVGIAEGAVDDLVALANTGRQQVRAALPMRDSEMFQGELGRIAADLKAAQAFLKVQADGHWRHALRGTQNEAAKVTQHTQTAAWLAATSVRIADACFALGGGAALYGNSPLQRRMRDLHAAAQHSGAQQSNYPVAGKLLLDNAPRLTG